MNTPGTWGRLSSPTASTSVALRPRELPAQDRPLIGSATEIVLGLGGVIPAEEARD